jgi:DNA-binding MarR family transcriptional regulator
MSRPLDFDPISEASRQWAAHGWEDACEGMAAITSIVRAQQLFLARIDAVLRPLELTFARYEVLMLLLFSRRGALPLNKIGARLQVHPTSVTNAVDRLEQQGLIKRVPHSSDRRTTLAEILPVGRELALTATRALNVEVFSEPGMDHDDLNLLVGVLQRFRQGAGDFGAAVKAEADGPHRPQSTREETFGGATDRGAGAGGADRATSS